MFKSKSKSKPTNAGEMNSVDWRWLPFKFRQSIISSTQKREY